MKAKVTLVYQVKTTIEVEISGPCVEKAREEAEYQASIKDGFVSGSADVLEIDLDYRSHGSYSEFASLINDDPDFEFSDTLDDFKEWLETHQQS